MRIAFCGYDFFSETLEALVQAGHDVVAIFSELTDDQYNFNAEVTAISAELNVPIYYGRITAENIQYLAEKGCDVLISGAYSYKIPSLEGTGIKGINVHPTHLPEGRGPWPLPWLILKEKETTALTAHKLVDEMDAGDILAQKEILLQQGETIDTLSAKLKMQAPDLVLDVLDDLENVWEKAVAQGEGEYWEMPSEKDYTLNPKSSVKEIDKTIRAFGKFETEVTLNNDVMYDVTHAKVWQEKHDFSCGDVVHQSPSELVFAAADGFVCLTHFKETDLTEINEA